MIGSAVLVAAGVFLLVGAGLPLDEMILPGIFSSNKSWFPLYPPTARIAGIGCFVLLYLVNNGSRDPVWITVTSGITFFLIALSLLLGVRQGLHR